MIQFRSIEVRPYLLGDFALMSKPYLVKNFKTSNSKLQDEDQFDFAVNSRRLVIEQGYGALKN